MAEYTKEKKGVSPVTAGAVGAVIGALGSAAAIALSKRENREKVGQKFGQARHKANDILQKTKRDVEHAKEKAQEKATMTERKMQEK